MRRPAAILYELAGSPPQSGVVVRRLSSKGEIQLNGARGSGARSVHPREARRWLAARGVEGFRG